MEQDTKENLLYSAIHRFGEYSFDKISIRQTAKHAGTNSALISYYFGSK
jgi:AcrR family transcriptional regulator